MRRLSDALSRCGVSVHPYLDPVVKYHAKYLVVDDGPAIVTSLNFTKKCFKRTLDALAVTHDAAVVRGLWHLLQADRNGPERARAQIAALIRRATRRLILVDAKLSDPTMLTLMAERRREGLEVQLLTEKSLHGLRTHGKILVIDDRLALVGSIALTALSLEFRREVALVVDTQAAVGQLLSAVDESAWANDGAV